MASFNEFCAKVKKGFSNLGSQVEKAADTASLRIRLAGVESKLSDYFLEFGKLTYAGLRGTASEEDQKRVESLLTMIDGKTAEKQQLEDELARRAAPETKTEYEATAEEPTDTSADKEDTAEELPAPAEEPKAE